MQANWSLILNVLLLGVVVVAIARLIKTRKYHLKEQLHYNFNTVEKKSHPVTSSSDDIIAVRKIDLPLTEEGSNSVALTETNKPKLFSSEKESMTINVDVKEPLNKAAPPKPSMRRQTLMVFLLAKENRQFAGYELLQTVLTAGLRFGEGGLFHRHQLTNKESTILCSLAAATASGTFDLQNIGAFSVRGLCLYMRSTGFPEVDLDRLNIMLDIARQLSDGLDAYLLDDKKMPLDEQRILEYQNQLTLNVLSETEETI